MPIFRKRTGGGNLNTNQIFAIYTLTGNERLLRTLILSILPDIGNTSLFIPQKVAYSRVRGKRRKAVCDLFPGYLFLQSDDPEKFFFELKAVPKLSNLLHDGDYNFVPLTEQETNFLNLICSLSVKELEQKEGEPASLILPASQVRVIPRQEIKPGDIFLPRGNQGEVLHIIDGPLLQLAPYVASLDYRNRKAILDVDLFGVHNIHIGIRLVKDESTD